MAMDFIEACDASSSLAEITARFETFNGSLGFSSFVVGSLPTRYEAISDLTLMVTWPSELIKNYRDGNFFRHDPVARWGYSQTCPFSFLTALERGPKSKESLEIADQFRDFGIRDGRYVPIGMAARSNSYVTLSRSDTEAPSPAEELLIGIVATAFHDQVFKAVGKEVLMAQLSPRESEALTWAAYGKSAWDTGQVLGISEGTVEKLLASARRKLGAVNTSQAVARGLHSRQIRL